MKKAPVPPGFRDVPNVGPAMAADFVRLGFENVRQLAAEDPQRLYDRLCALDKTRHDPCVLDTFHAVVDFAKDGKRRPWWHYSRKRLGQAGRASQRRLH